MALWVELTAVGYEQSSSALLGPQVLCLFNVPIQCTKPLYYNLQSVSQESDQFNVRKINKKKLTSKTTFRLAFYKQSDFCSAKAERLWISFCIIALCELLILLYAGKFTVDKWPSLCSHTKIIFVTDLCK